MRPKITHNIVWCNYKGKTLDVDSGVFNSDQHARDYAKDVQIAQEYPTYVVTRADGTEVGRRTVGWIPTRLDRQL